MGGIAAAFPQLQIIRRRVDAEDDAVLHRAIEEFICLERRLFLPGTEVSPHKATRLVRGICGRFQARAEAFVAVVRGFLDFAIHAKLPAVVEATDAVLLDAPEHERSTAMHAKFIHHANASGRGAEDDEVFAQHSRADGCAIGRRDLPGCADRLPVTSHHATHGRVDADAGENFVFRCADHGGLPVA